MSLPTPADLGIDRRVPSRKAAWIALVNQLKSWLDSLPEALSDFPSRPVVAGTDGAGLTLAGELRPVDFGKAQVSNFQQAQLRLASDAVTLSASGSVRSGMHVSFERASAVNVTISPDLPEGWTISWTQAGAGVVTFIGASGVVIRHRLNHTRSAGQHAVGGLRVDRNAGGTVEITLFGDTAAAS